MSNSDVPECAVGAHVSSDAIGQPQVHVCLAHFLMVVQYGINRTAGMKTIDGLGLPRKAQNRAGEQADSVRTVGARWRHGDHFCMTNAVRRNVFRK